MENKQKICNLLCAALKATRDQRDLADITRQRDSRSDIRERTRGKH